MHTHPHNEGGKLAGLKLLLRMLFASAEGCLGFSSQILQGM